MASVRLFYRKHASSYPGRPQDYDDPCLSESVEWRKLIETRVAKPKPKDKAFVDQAAAKFKENITKAIGNLRRMVEDQQTSLSVMDEPPLIASSERFFTEPVKSN